MNKNYKRAIYTSLFIGLLALGLNAKAAVISRVTETIGVNKSLSVGLNPPSSGSWSLNGNSNPTVAQVTVSQSLVTILGKSSGSSQVMVCANSGSECTEINVTVSGVLGVSTGLSHQPGSWVIQGQTVYYVTESGLIPITTWKIFLNNGGKAGNIVPLNEYDERLPLLPFMTLNDSRVK